MINIPKDKNNKKKEDSFMVVAIILFLSIVIFVIYIINIPSRNVPTAAKNPIKAIAKALIPLSLVRASMFAFRPIAAIAIDQRISWIVEKIGFNGAVNSGIKENIRPAPRNAHKNHGK